MVRLGLPHLHRDWAHPRHICAGDRALRFRSSAEGGPSSPLRRRDQGRRRRELRLARHAVCGVHGEPILQGGAAGAAADSNASPTAGRAFTVATDRRRYLLLQQVPGGEGHTELHFFTKFHGRAKNFVWLTGSGIFSGSFTFGSQAHVSTRSLLRPSVCARVRA